MRRLAVLLMVGAVAGCEASPPPAYEAAQPAPYRIGPDGLRIDNAGYRLDAEGWRIDEQGRRIGVVPPSRDDPANAVSGYWIAR